jgi:all-trans-retinol 13,14-reductase
MQQYDVVIIGSGLGGLASGVMLAKEGYKVCILEMNKQIGGALQVYSREKVIFDSGVHYVGGLEKGQNTYQVFKYLGIMDKVKIRKLDEDVFDAVTFGDDPKVYKYARGYDRFIKTMVADFPDEEEAIIAYINKIKDVCSKFPLYNLRTTDNMKDKVVDIDTRTYIESITKNEKLRNVLAGTNLLYAGQSYKTPFYVHALVINSYIESSYRFVDGGSQIAKYLHQEISSLGGKVLKHKKVVRLVEEGGELQYAETSEGEQYEGKIFISNIHPAKTLEITESNLIKKAYRNRLNALENSISIFYVNLVLKKNSFKQLNHNYYCFRGNDAWEAVSYTKESWPPMFAMFFSTPSNDAEFAEGVSILTYMRFEEVKKWEGTYHTTDHKVSRGEEYESFKKEKAEILMDMVEKRFSGIKTATQSMYVGSPLSLRDYLGNDDGTLYGVVKDSRDPLRTFIPPSTKIPNLYLTGQNLNMHGILGVCMSAILTCSSIVGMDYLVNKIKNA